jgi:alcohol dehydrogenase
MMLASTMAGLGMNPTRLGLVHALAMPLGSWKIKIAHGAANAVLLSHAMEFNCLAAVDVFAEVAIALGARVDGSNPETLAKESVRKVKEIGEACGIPVGLGVLGLTDDMIPSVCREAMQSGNIPVNPREVTITDLENICRKAL